MATRPAWVSDQLFPFESRFLDVNGAQVHYIDEGVGPVFLGAARKPHMVVSVPAHRPRPAGPVPSANARDLALFTMALSRENASPGRRRSLALGLGLSSA